MATSAATLSSNCFTPLGACRLRASRLKASGAFAPSPNNIVVSDFLIDLAAKLNVTKGDTFSEKDGCGNVRVTFTGCDHLESADVTINFIEFDPQLWEMLTGGIIYMAGGKVVGYELPSVTAACPNGVGLEVWSRAWFNDQQAVDTVTGLPVWIRYGFPKVVFTMGDFSIGNSVTKTPVVGHATPNAQFSLGPLADWPGTLTNIYGWYYDTAIPAASCGYLSQKES